MRLSIGRLMTGVAVLAITLALVLLDTRNPTIHRFTHDQVVGVLPMASILSYGLLCGALDLASGRTTRQHLIGFQMAGWASILAYLSWCASTYEWRDRPLRLVVDATSWALGGGFALDDPRIMAAHMAVFFIPELLSAAFGGWLGSRLGIVLVKKGSQFEQSRSSGPHFE